MRCCGAISAPDRAFGGALLAWGATFLHWYMVQQPTASHAPSAFASALALWLWDRDRQQRGPAGFLLLGLALGLAMCVRWQNGVLLALPGLELCGRFWRTAEALTAGGLARLPGAGAPWARLPQMAVWKALYDKWLLPYPPHGTDFVRLGHPFFLETLFSSRHGLLSWTPVFWAGYLGFIPLLRRRPGLGYPLLLPLVLMTYVNLCSGDWWAAPVPNRRFDSLRRSWPWAGRFRTWRGPRPPSPAIPSARRCRWWPERHPAGRSAEPAATRRHRMFREWPGSARIVAGPWAARPRGRRVDFAWRHGRPPPDDLWREVFFYRQNTWAATWRWGRR
jgi:hypothetical protein